MLNLAREEVLQRNMRRRSATAEPLIIAGVPIASRLFIGSAGYPNQQVLLDAIEASGAELVTASIRRIDLSGYPESLVDCSASVTGCCPIRRAAPPRAMPC